MNSAFSTLLNLRWLTYVGDLIQPHNIAKVRYKVCYDPIPNPNPNLITYLKDKVRYKSR